MNSFIKKTKLISIFAFMALISGCNLLNKFSKEKEKSKMEHSRSEKTIFTFLGAPGSGKGTLASKCVENLGFEVLSTGDLCRKHISNNTPTGQQLEKFIKTGELVPDHLITKMVKEWLASRTKSENPIILDGFPRTEEQARKLLEIIRETMPDHEFRIIKLEIPEKEISDRLVNRRVCKNKSCNSIYNTSMEAVKKGICTKCGGKLIQRADDKPEIIAERFKIYSENEDKLIKFYESNGYQIEKLNVSKKSIDQIFQAFSKLY